MARERWKWKDHLYPVLSTKPAEVVQEACQVLEKHGCRVEERLKSELYTARTHAHTKYSRFGGPIGTKNYIQAVSSTLGTLSLSITFLLLH